MELNSCAAAPGTLAAVTITVQADQPKPISPDLFGIFFEDLNYAADGGLYAELLQNRSFAYTPADHRDWNFFTAWEILGATCAITLGTESPVHPNNPHYLVLQIREPNGVCRLRNNGFEGIAVKAGAGYEVSLFAHVLTGAISPLTVRLESKTGEMLGEATISAPGPDWARYAASITSSADAPNARFVVQFAGSGALALDVVSLFPRDTFRSRPNGLRADLAGVIADLKPRFVRFPGGCLAHGDGLDNMYRWKDTIGPIETRKEQRNIWGYHQTVGLGYFEYFQFCEDAGAKPLPVVPAGVCCQNSGNSTGQGQRGLPLEEMPEYIQEILDLIEWANGPTDSAWGAKRAAAGHPEPFGLEYLGIGNEDHITPAFAARFRMIYEAVRVRHPEIIVIGTVGPFHSGEDYEAGWKIADELKLPMVDEHYYERPDWFWDNLERYDGYDRDRSQVYLGEYAAHEDGRKSTLRSALAEAAYLTALERNGDLVRLASYAPLLAKRHHTQWTPDLIYFDNGQISPTINYEVQRLFGHNAGDIYLPTTVTAPDYPQTVAASCVQDSATGEIIVKIVSRADGQLTADIDLTSAGALKATANRTILTGDPLAENPFGGSPRIVPQTSVFPISPKFNYEIPPHSLSIIRIGPPHENAPTGSDPFPRPYSRSHFVMRV